MDSQGTLFPEIEPGPGEPEPRGFRYREEIVNEEEEAALAASLAQLDLKPFEFQGHIGHRRVVSFGLQYDYDRRSVEAAADIPAFLSQVLLRAAKFAGCGQDAIRQVGINEYRAGAGVGWHKDKPQFGVIIGVSLLAPAIMRFRKTEGPRWVRASYELQPRSVYVLSGEARTDWEHSVPPVDRLRYSINFRTLSNTAVALGG